MRRRAWALLALVGLAVVVAWPAQDTAAWQVVMGLLVAAAAGVALSLLPWKRWIPGWQPMPGLFQRPRPGERWCGACGRPAARGGACPTCGDTPKARSRNPDSK